MYTVKRSRAGLGLFATTHITKGTHIINYTGNRLTSAEAEIRGGKYLFEINDEWTIDGSPRTNLARYINHSCRPNAYPEISDDEQKIFIFAKRTIKPGEEITYHYGKDYVTRVILPAGCRCQKCLASTGQTPPHQPHQ